MRFFVWIKYIVLSLCLSFSYSYLSWGQQSLEGMRSPQTFKQVTSSPWAQASSSQNAYREASQYFQNGGSRYQDGARHLMLQLQGTVNGTAYRWFSDVDRQVERVGLALSYRLSDIGRFADQVLRVRLQNFRFDSDNKDSGNKATKLAILLGISFPDTPSNFPLYFGGAVGGGIFLSQVKNKSVLAFEYQIFLGWKSQPIYRSGGISLELGLHNHIHLLSKGQYSSYYFATGLNFLF